MQILTELLLIKHLQVLENDAQRAKDFLEECGALNNDFLPIKRDGFVFWPLKFEVDGTVIELKGTPSTKTSRDYRLHLPLQLQSLAPRAFDIFGNIAIIKIPEEILPHAKIIADSLIANNLNIDKVALDLGVTGEYRIRKLKMLSGDHDFIAKHKENGLIFTLDISKVYFSPRLSMERQRLSMLISKEEHVLDAFAGAAPFSVTLAKKGAFVTSVDSNPASEYWANENFRVNQVSRNGYEFFCSKIEDINFNSKSFDRIIMNNPTNPLSYLDKLSKLVKPGGWIHLYFIDSKDEDLDILNYLNEEFRCDSIRKVHPYSPSSTLKVFDITRRKDNVQNTNQ